jgi:uncharacterized spore protein YtfJ
MSGHGNDDARRSEAIEGTAPIEAMLNKLDAVKEVLTVRRAFGESYEVDGVTVIPVAAVRGGGGGGGGEGSAPNDKGTGSGGGVGFAVLVRPLGVYTVKDGAVRWQPAIDPLRAIIVAEIAAAALFVAVRRLIRR